MHRVTAFLFLFAVIGATAQTQTRDAHLREAVSNAIFARSAFAHGYRHGYEEGYHHGNIDINMGRPARTKLSQFHDLSRGYAPEFGPKKSFESGFFEGLKAGYSDGYAGRTFRAVDTLRQVASSLNPSPVPADPRNLYFDQGFSTGYNEGLKNAKKDDEPVQPASFQYGTCGPFHPARQQDQAAEGSFCEGYRRGFALGRADAAVLQPDHPALQASK